MDASGERSSLPGTALSALGYSLAIFLSAFLLFAVQPLLARFILPWFGGAAAVWTTCLLFFQAALLAGYAYAHWSARALSPKAQAWVHLALLIAALCLLPITPSPKWEPRPETNPTLRILLLLTVTVGLPYFALSTTSPLLQHWFAREHPKRSPYRLYALSNVGSLLALWSYPFVFEPLLTRRWQSWGWSLLFVLFAITCAWCAIRQCRAPSEEFIATDAVDQHGLLTQSRSLVILILAACASSLLLAGTNIMCQDVAPVPFLWVLPLSLYLLTFILCFEYPRLYQRWLIMPAAALASFAVPWALAYSTPLWLQIATLCGALFLLCMFCHGEIARLRPRAKQLTQYYLLVSLGGVIGSAFVSLAAPVILKRYLEFYIIVLLVWIGGMGVLLMSRTSPLRSFRRPLVWSIPLTAFVALALFYWNMLVPNRQNMVLTHRNFYGVMDVIENDDGNPLHKHRTLMHNGTVHGLQFTDPFFRGLPTVYYARPGGGALALDTFRTNQTRHVGIVGLGAGGLASFARPGDVFQYYELDPDVVTVAGSCFTYLADCKGKLAMTIGDARLSMVRQEPQQFDVIVLDAFSGDSVPVHLMTLEAFELYQRHLKAGGLIAVHISNKHLNLFPPAHAGASHLGMVSLLFSTDSRMTPYPSAWLLASQDVEFLKSLSNEPSARRVQPRVMKWTDEYAPLFPLRW